MLALAPDGRSLCLYNDTARTVSEIEKFSQNDAKNYPDFVNSFARIGRVLAPLISMTPPSIDQPTAGDVWQLGKVGLAFRGLGKKDEYRLLRWGPMAVADLVSEFFETELLRAAVAARGIYGAFAGPWSAGTSLGLLWQAAMDGSAIPSASYPKGGMGGLADALANAAKAAGAEIRTMANVSTVAGVYGDKPKVVLDGGEEIESRVVVSNADPRIDVSQPRRSDRARAELLIEDAQLPRSGRGGKDQSRAGRLACISRLERRRSQIKTFRAHSHRS